MLTAEGSDCLLSFSESVSWQAGEEVVFDLVVQTAV